MELHTEVWVAALVRRAELDGAFAAVTRKGDARAGQVLVRVFNQSDRSARLFTAVDDPDGTAWMEPLPGASEGDLDAYVERQLRYDPDLWVVEIEDRQGRHFLTEPVRIP